MRLVRDDGTGTRVGQIVEVEAYGGPDDLASHARFGVTPRNKVMFGPAGIAYVYLVYGMYDCLNVVTGLDGVASAVLIRAVYPLAGQDLMRGDRWAHRSRRRTAGQATATATTVAPARARFNAIPDERLASGPGLVAAAFGVDTTWTGLDLCASDSPLRLEPPAAGDPSVGDVVATRRIGVDYAGATWSARPWRFAVAGHPSVSHQPR